VKQNEGYRSQTPQKSTANATLRTTKVLAGKIEDRWRPQRQREASQRDLDHHVNQLSPRILSIKRAILQARR
jgi:hypothetical protein